MRCVAEVSSFNLMHNLCMYYEKQKSYDKTELTFQPTLVDKQVSADLWMESNLEQNVYLEIITITELAARK